LPNEDFPLRVDGVTAGWAAERRPEDVIPAARTDAWQLVYVRSGTIEERCDDRRVLLRAGGLLFHQPAETFGMRPVGEVPPDVLRLDFLCTQAGMDRFRGAVFHAEPQEQHDLNWLMDAVTEYFEPPDTLGQATVPKEEQPYGAQQQLAIHLENLLILLARRYKRARKPGVRLRRERRQTALVDAARTYFAKNLERELRVDEVCEAIGCTRPQLQAAFRTRLRHTAMEEFSAMRLDYRPQGAEILPADTAQSVRGGRAHGLPQRGLLQPKIQGGHRQHPQRLPPPAAGFAGPPPKQATKRQRRIENLYCRNTAKKVK
jgi:AraC-like DNA-binding protein